MMRASAVVKRQSMRMLCRLRRASQAAASSVSIPLSGMRWAKHCRPNTDNSISAMFSQLPCLGV